MLLVHVNTCNISFKNKIFELLGHARGRGRGRRSHLKRTAVLRGFGIPCVFSLKRSTAGAISAVPYTVSK